MPAVSHADMNRESLMAVVASLRAMANRYEQLVKEMDTAGIETLPKVPYIEGLRLALERLAKHRDAACSAFDQVLMAALPSDPQKRKPASPQLTRSEQMALEELAVVESAGPESRQNAPRDRRRAGKEKHQHS